MYKAQAQWRCVYRQTWLWWTMHEELKLINGFRKGCQMSMWNRYFFKSLFCKFLNYFKNFVNNFFLRIITSSQNELISCSVHLATLVNIHYSAVRRCILLITRERKTLPSMQISIVSDPWWPRPGVVLVIAMFLLQLILWNNWFVFPLLK